MGDNDDILDRSCTCFLGCAPCSFCTDTYECEKCGTLVITDEQEKDSAVQQMICDECYEPETAEEHERVMAAVRAAAGG